MATYNIDKLSSGGNTYKIGTPNFYGQCSTAQATLAKTANNTTAPFYLDGGSLAGVKFTYNVPANSTLNINGLGAYPIYYHNLPLFDRVIRAGDFCMFSFDNIHNRWLLVGGDRSILNYTEQFYRPGDTFVSEYAWFVHGVRSTANYLYIPFKLDKKIGYNVTAVTPTVMQGHVRQYAAYLFGDANNAGNFITNSKITLGVNATLGKDIVRILATKSDGYGGTTYSPTQVTINGGFTLVFS